MSTIHTHGRTPAPLAERVEALRRKHTHHPRCIADHIVWTCGRSGCNHLTHADAQFHCDEDRGKDASTE